MGTVKPHRSTLVALANVFGCASDRLYAEPTPVEIQRLRVGLTISQLARRANLPEDRIARIETGEEVPDRTAREQIASAMSCAVDSIFPKNEQRPAGNGPLSKATTGAGGRYGAS